MPYLWSSSPINRNGNSIDLNIWSNSMLVAVEFEGNNRILLQEKQTLHLCFQIPAWIVLTLFLIFGQIWAPLLL